MLLDTHVLLWFLDNNPRLPKSIKEKIENTESVFVSIASIWEISIKVNIGKLTVTTPLEMIRVNMMALNIQELPITFEDAITYASLPLTSNHRDPFDRILVAQAMNRSLSLVSADTKFDPYAISRVWE
ncbi:MAG: type II toxin-antitoxin system VapC family toxin [Hormoscilla sp. GUM202]|nr:type II toxin-antitoxin system VapC family toxin [Hormoscilla sp. GUM202]